MIPNVFSKDRENIIASYDYTDFINGQGVVIVYPVICWDGDLNTYLINSRAINSSSTTGVLGAGTYLFETKNYIQSMKIRGDAYLSGYADYSANNIDFKVEAFVVSGGETASIGTLDWNVETEYTATTTGFVLKNTFTINDYVWSVVSQQVKICNNGLNMIKHIFYYEGDQTAEVLSGNNTYVYAELISLNPHPKKYVTKIEMYAKQSGGGGAEYKIKEQDVYSTSLSDYSETSISNEISSNTYGADQPFSIEIPLTDTNLKIGERLRLKTVVTGASGGIVVDPTNTINENPSLKLNLPFKIDL